MLLSGLGKDSKQPLVVRLFGWVTVHNVASARGHLMYGVCFVRASDPLVQTLAFIEPHSAPRITHPARRGEGSEATPVLGLHDP